jgi:hypothetical protein
MTPSPSSQEEARELKAWPFYGYAPGNYSAYCALGCGEQFEGDKRSLRCLDCAVKYAKTLLGQFEEHAAATERPTPDLGDVDELVEELRELKKGWVTSKSFSKFIDRVADTIIALRAALDKKD